MKVFNRDNEYQQYYPPSILIVKDTSSHTCKLKQTLETNGCQVYQIDISCLDTIRQQYFDLVVLDIERPEVIADIDDLSTPALTETSLVLLTSAAQAENEQLASRILLPVCCIAKDIAAEALLPLIKQKHYLTYRYL